MKKFVLLFGIVLFLFSCQKDDLTNSENVDNQDLMLKSGKPDQPGDNLKVFRYEGTSSFQLYDEEMNLTAFVAVDIQQYCSTLGTEGLDVLNYQDIVKEGAEDESPRVHTLMKQGEVAVSVWEGTISSCVQLIDPIFVGTGNLVYTDNDVYAYDRDGNNHNVWGLRLNGDGINIKYHAMWDGEDPATLKESTNIMVK